MKTYLVFFTAIIFLSLWVYGYSPSQTKNSMWTIDLIKTKQDQQENYLKFIDGNWAQFRSFMKKKGSVKNYKVLSLPPSEQLSDWNVVLITEYSGKSSFDRRNEIFEEYKSSLNGKTDLTQAGMIINPQLVEEIKFNQAFNQSFSSELEEKFTGAKNKEPEIDSAVRAPLENYLSGHATGRAEFMRKAFNPGAKIEGYGANGKFISWTLDDYLKGMPGKPADDEAKRKRWIESVKVTGNTAVAELKFDYPTIRITDYILLLKVDSEWKIVNKTFQGEMKSSQ